MPRLRLFNLIRHRHQCVNESEDIETSSPSSSVSSKLRYRFRKNCSGINSKSNKSIFRRVSSKRGLGKSKKSNRNRHIQQQAETFSLSEDDASNMSSLFSPVNNVMPVNECAVPLLQPSATMMSGNPTFFIPGEDEILKIKAELIGFKDIVGQKDAEILNLQQLMEDLKELKMVELELKDIELEKKNMELEKLQMELSKANFEIEQQSQVIEALASAHHKYANRNWLSSIPDLFLDLI